jgi:hypothetical protein
LYGCRADNDRELRLLLRTGREQAQHGNEEQLSHDA